MKIRNPWEGLDPLRRRDDPLSDASNANRTVGDGSPNTATIKSPKGEKTVAKNTTGVGKPNSAIQGDGGGKNSTGNQTRPGGMPNAGGSFAPHYGPGGAGGKGRGPAQGPMADQEGEPGGPAVKVNPSTGMPNHAGTGADDLEPTLKDSEKSPGPKGKKGKPKKFTSISQLRDYAKSRGL